MDDVTTDEIHLKGFDSGGDCNIRLIRGQFTHAGVYVGGVTVAIVGAAADRLFGDVDTTNADPPVESRTKVQANIRCAWKEQRW